MPTKIDRPEAPIDSVETVFCVWLVSLSFTVAVGPLSKARAPWTETYDPICRSADAMLARSSLPEEARFSVPLPRSISYPAGLLSCAGKLVLKSMTGSPVPPPLTPLYSTLIPEADRVRSFTPTSPTRSAVALRETYFFESPCFLAIIRPKLTCSIARPTAFGLRVLLPATK